MAGLKWVSLDGTDAVGKTTLLRELVDHLRHAYPDHKVDKFHEFSSTAVGGLIRQRIEERYFFQMGNDEHLPVGESLLLAADLALQLETLQRSSDTGEPMILVSDRGPLSLVVYQATRLVQHAGYSYEQAASWVGQLLSLLPTPDLTVILYADEVTLRQRLIDRQADLTEAEMRFVLQLQDSFLVHAEHGAHPVLRSTPDQTQMITRISELVARL